MPVKGQAGRRRALWNGQIQPAARLVRDYLGTFWWMAPIWLASFAKVIFDLF